MPTPASLPDCITKRPPPAEWVRRLQAIDPDLYMCWNPIHQSGPRWCVLRHVGVMGADHRNQFIVGFGDLGKAIQSGEWSYVRALEWPDGTAADELCDIHILHLYRDDFFRRYGREKGGASLILTSEHDAAVKGRMDNHKKLMNEAFDSANADRTITRNATSVLVSGGRR